MLCSLLVALSVVQGTILITEALTYRFARKVGGWRALGTSIAANVASFVVGLFVFWLLVVPDRPWVLAPWILVSLGAAIAVLVEAPIVALMNRRFPERRRLWTVAVVANICTYVIAVCALHAWALSDLGASLL